MSRKRANVSQQALRLERNEIDPPPAIGPRSLPDLSGLWQGQRTLAGYRIISTGCLGIATVNRQTMGFRFWSAKGEDCRPAPP